MRVNLQRTVEKRGRTGKKKVRGDTLQGSDTRVKSIKVTMMSKKGRQFFQEKIGMTPLVAVPGDTHHSDATDVIKAENDWWDGPPQVAMQQ